jgi:hypothetical protein
MFCGQKRPSPIRSIARLIMPNTKRGNVSGEAPPEQRDDRQEKGHFGDKPRNVDRGTPDDANIVRDRGGEPRDPDRQDPRHEGKPV